MKCCVVNCNSDTKTTPEHLGITFYLFPTNTETRDRWLRTLWTKGSINENSMICSEHFNDQDFFYTKSGTKCIRNDSTPFVMSCDNLETPAAFSVCRICLTTGTIMVDLKELKLQQIYQQLTGQLMDLRLPQVVCSECSQRLRSANMLMYKALKSLNLLLNLCKGSKCLKIKDVKTINRHSNKLKSNLIQTYYDSTDYDYEIKDNELIKNEPAIDEFTNVNNHNGIIDNDNGIIDDEDYEEIEFLTEEEIKEEESDEILLDQYEGFESDDDKKLSEISPVITRKNSKAKKNKEKVEKRVKESKKNDEEEIHFSFMDISISRRRINDPPIQALFKVTYLTLEEQIQEIEQRQESSYYKDSPYKCTVCYRGFKQKDHYDVHVVKHSEKRGAFECCICKSRKKTMKALRKHLSAQHTERLTCKRCSFVTINRNVAKSHLEWHSGTKYQCPHCPSEFEKVTSYMGHLRLKHGSDFICSHCGCTFLSKKGVDAHKKIQHLIDYENIPEDGPYCEVCDVKFVSEEAHSRHLKLSSRHLSDDDPKRISNVYKGTHNKNRAMRPRSEARTSIHPKEDIPPETGPFTCEQCGIQLRDLRLYAYHFRRAHPDKNRTKYSTRTTPCMCDQCGRLYPCMALLNDHMWVHTGKKTYKCSLCPKSFTQKSNLAFHEKFHTENQPSFECPLCGKQFSFESNMRRHMLIHTGFKPYKCETCGKSFTTSGEQKSHVQHVHMKKPWPKRVRRKDGTWRDKRSED